MRIFKYLLIVIAVSLFASCTDWLTVYPQNAETQAGFWRSKKDVEEVVMSGYYYLRDMTINSLIPWGELRSGEIFDARHGNDMQSFQIKPTDQAYSDWGPLYQIINVANDVIANAPKVQAYDPTYTNSELNSHLCEAYFLRALSYFYIVRNWRDAPLITKPYADDSNNFKQAKATEAELIAQIKSDIRTALATGAAKEYYNTTWETKGRATRWAFYALMTDVCLWSEDYNTAYAYSDSLLDSPSPRKPTFMKTPTHNSWFSMFNPGNSNESIFEIQWNYQQGQNNMLPEYFDDVSTNRKYEISYKMLGDFNKEYSETLSSGKEAVRTMYGGYYTSNPTTYQTATSGYVWKYCGSQTLSDKRTPTYYDPNFIIYRVTDVMLMKAEALILRGHGTSESDYRQALSIMNQVRTRSNLDSLVFSPSYGEEDMLKMLLHERQMEFIGEGKSWYDILRLGRIENGKYKQDLLIQTVLDNDDQASQSWLRSVLNSGDDALFLPVWQKELTINTLLTQNPYYN